MVRNKKTKTKNGAASDSLTTEARGSNDDEWIPLEYFQNQVKHDIFKLLKEANVQNIKANIVKKLEGLHKPSHFFIYLYI